MIKALLVDDEYLVCNFLRSIIVWEDYGYTVVGQAYNGKDALEKVEDLQPDLVFLDIGMPLLDGIGVIQVLNQRYPEIKVIILSSYSDYDYIRDTMKLGAEDYILKHRLDSNELIRLLQNLDFKSEKDINTRGGNLEPNGYYFNVIRDSKTRSFLEKSTQKVPSSLAPIDKLINVAVAKIKLSIFSEHNNVIDQQRQESFIHAILATCMQISNQEGNVKIIYMGKYIITFLVMAKYNESKMEHILRTKSYMSIIHDAVLKYHNTYMIWKYSENVIDKEYIPDEYNALIKTIHTFPMEETRTCKLSMDKERKILLAILTRDRKRLSEVLKEVFSTLYNKVYSESEFNLMIGDLLTLAIKSYDENKIPFIVENNSEMINLTLEKAFSYFANIFSTLITEIERKEKFSGPIKEIISYVNSNYAKDIGLNEIAVFCNLNTSYTSTLFKKEVGINLVQYINRVRVYNAGKFMIINNDNPTTASVKVGMHNYNNFFKIFKSITGLTPSKFKKSMQVDWLNSFNPLSNG